MRVNISARSVRVDQHVLTSRLHSFITQYSSMLQLLCAHNVLPTIIRHPPAYYSVDDPII
jgi:hypothetical protein